MPADPRPYSAPAIALHWAIALLVVLNLGGGYVAAELTGAEDARARALGRELIGLHQWLGLVVLALALLRLLLRLAEGLPPLPRHMTPAERRLARGVHGSFHLLLLALPLAGWIMVSARSGLAGIPALPLGHDPPLATAAGATHAALASAMIALLLLHVAAALKHKLLDRDDAFGRMWPRWHRRG